MTKKEVNKQLEKAFVIGSLSQEAEIEDFAFSLANKYDITFVKNNQTNHLIF